MNKLYKYVGTNSYFFGDYLLVCEKWGIGLHVGDDEDPLSIYWKLKEEMTMNIYDLMDCGYVPSDIRVYQDDIDHGEWEEIKVEVH